MAEQKSATTAAELEAMIAELGAAWAAADGPESDERRRASHRAIDLERAVLAARPTDALALAMQLRVYRQCCDPEKPEVLDHIADRLDAIAAGQSGESSATIVGRAYGEAARP